MREPAKALPPCNAPCLPACPCAHAAPASAEACCRCCCLGCRARRPFHPQRFWGFLQAHFLVQEVEQPLDEEEEEEEERREEGRDLRGEAGEEGTPRGVIDTRPSPGAGAGADTRTRAGAGSGRAAAGAAALAPTGKAHCPKEVGEEGEGEAEGAGGLLTTAAAAAKRAALHAKFGQVSQLLLSKTLPGNWHCSVMPMGRGLSQLTCDGSAARASSGWPPAPTWAGALVISHVMSHPHAQVLRGQGFFWLASHPGMGFSNFTWDESSSCAGSPWQGLLLAGQPPRHGRGAEPGGRGGACGLRWALVRSDAGGRVARHGRGREIAFSSWTGRCCAAPCVLGGADCQRIVASLLLQLAQLNT